MSANTYTAVTVPLAVAVPALAGASPNAPPEEIAKFISPELWGILSSVDHLTVRQHIKLLPKGCCTCPPCMPQENTYSVYAGLTQDNEAEFLRADEVSDDWNRCCCAPFHPLRLEVRQYIPLPGDSNVSDFSHISEEMRADFGRFSGRDKQARMRQLYLQQPVLFSVVRNDGQRCCYKCPCRVLSTFVCCHCCQDGVFVYAGPVQDNPEGKEVGRPYQLEQIQDRLIGSAIQPLFGGINRPTIDLRDSKETEESVPYGTISGPCFFGGWIECCCDFEFLVSRFGGPRTGDLGKIVKKKPQSLAGAARELFTNADVYTINFAQGLTPSQKVTIMAGQLLADYMFFDGSTEKCDEDDSAYYCNICFYSCFGALCPCYIAIPKNK